MLPFISYYTKNYRQTNTICQDVIYIFFFFPLRGYGFFDILHFKREMKKYIAFFTLSAIMCANAYGAATCSRANLTRCLDSACAINVNMNPAARCQYCGTASAGEPTQDKGLRSVSVGTSAANTLSAKELQAAPSDPGRRYAWATAECIKKISGCTADDVSAAYDALIEQSCRAAGINAQMASLRAAASKTISKSACSTGITACMVDAKRCAADWRECEQNADFDKFFSDCTVESKGCDEYFAAIRTELIGARDTAIKNADTVLANIVAAYQAARATKLAAARTACTDNSGRESCIKSVCERSMRNKCGVGFESEKAAATQLCKFYDIACATLR